MIKVYEMPSYPDCTEITEKIKTSGRESELEVINTGEHVAHLEALSQPRDREEASRPVGEGGYVGIPCFAWEDGTVSFDPAEFGLREGLISVTDSGKIGVVTDFMHEIRS